VQALKNDRENRRDRNDTQSDRKGKCKQSFMRGTKYFLSRVYFSMSSLSQTTNQVVICLLLLLIAFLVP